MSREPEVVLRRAYMLPPKGGVPREHREPEGREPHAPPLRGEGRGSRRRARRGGYVLHTEGFGLGNAPPPSPRGLGATSPLGGGMVVGGSVWFRMLLLPSPQPSPGGAGKGSNPVGVSCSPLRGECRGSTATEARGVRLAHRRLRAGKRTPSVASRRCGTPSPQPPPLGEGEEGRHLPLRGRHVAPPQRGGNSHLPHPSGGDEARRAEPRGGKQASLPHRARACGPRARLPRPRGGGKQPSPSRPSGC